MTSDTIKKGQKKSSETTVLNAENVSNASKLRPLSSTRHIENDDTTIT